MNVYVIRPVGTRSVKKEPPAAARCISYLTRGIGVIVVDILTNRSASVHNELIAQLGRGEPFLLPPAATTYASAFQPSRQPSGDQIELWPMPLRLGQPSPVLPLALRNFGIVPVDLEETYSEARQRGRLA
jgi:hypothetical protein